MLARLFSIAIVLFWITMTALLVRSEVWPNFSAVREVPFEHVSKLLWQHQQASDLTIWNDGMRSGHLHLQPKVRAAPDATRTLEYSGNLQIRVPGSGRQRISWDGLAEFDNRSELKAFSIGLSVREPSMMRAEVRIQPGEHVAHYRLLNAGRELQSRTFSLDAAGLRKVLEELALEPALLETFQFGRNSAPKFTAQQSSLKIHGERIETYLLTMQQSGQTLLEAQVSQLGQVLQIKTLVGYSLAPDDLLP